jgi:hypothetical protein
MHFGLVFRLSICGAVSHFLISAELGSVFYSVKEKNFDDRGMRRQADREFSRRAELETEMAKQREL